MSHKASPTSAAQDMMVAAPMKHIVKILTLPVTLSALWVGLLQASIIPRSYTWLDIIEAKEFLKDNEVDIGYD